MVDYILNTSKDKDCFIIYMKGAEITQRKIRVLEVTEDVVRAYCYFRKGPRIFRKENILSASLAPPGGYRRMGETNEQLYRMDRRQELPQEDHLRLDAGGNGTLH